MNTTNETFEQRVNREREERLIRFQGYEEKINKVAEILGGRLEKTRDDDPFPYQFTRELTLKDGSLWVSAETYQHKMHFHFSGIYPRTKKGEYINPYDYKETQSDSINVSLNKTAEQIAKDITRRLMPEYAFRLSKVRKQIADSENYHESQQGAIKKISKDSGLNYSDHRENGIIQFDFNHPSGKEEDSGNGSIEPIGKGTVKMSLSYLSPEQAVEILKVLKAKQ